jgi:ElaB/YqjD/DUF883 family membrane-anchored ribosome-binding protein
MNKSIINNLSEELENAIEGGYSILESVNLEERLDEFKTEAELLIRKNPIASVAIGVAIGYIFGKILR